MQVLTITATDNVGNVFVKTLTFDDESVGIRSCPAGEAPLPRPGGVPFARRPPADPLFRSTAPGGAAGDVGSLAG
jgi:hypothetical protein